jgi:hypothetical protein
VKKKQKSAKQKKVVPTVGSDPPSEQNAVKYDDNFYDLDDEFIDDGDLEMNQDEMATELLYGPESSLYINSQKDFVDEEGKEGEGEEELK